MSEEKKTRGQNGFWKLHNMRKSKIFWGGKEENKMYDSEKERDVWFFISAHIKHCVIVLQTACGQHILKSLKMTKAWKNIAIEIMRAALFTFTLNYKWPYGTARKAFPWPQKNIHNMRPALHIRTLAVVSFRLSLWGLRTFAQGQHRDGNEGMEVGFALAGFVLRIFAFLTYSFHVLPISQNGGQSLWKRTIFGRWFACQWFMWLHALFLWVRSTNNQKRKRDQLTQDDKEELIWPMFTSHSKPEG